LARWLAYTSLLFIVLSFDNPFKEKIKFYLFIDGLVILLLGFVQYFFFSSLKSLYYLGWDEHMYRMFSVFLDPNYAGAFFVLYFIFIGNLIYKSNKHRRYLIIILLFTLIAIFLTFSRSALLMLIIGTSVFLFIIKRKKLILILIGSIMLFALIFSSKFYVENMNLLREASINARLANYSTALKIITDRPLLGVGFDSYRYAKEMYGIKTGWVDAPSHADAGVDNSFLFVLATTGVIGFCAYLYLWATILKKASFLVISSIIALFISALFINSLFFPPLMLWIWFILALL
jgi:O-antigen ligase